MFFVTTGIMYRSASSRSIGEVLTEKYRKIRLFLCQITSRKGRIAMNYAQKTCQIVKIHVPDRNFVHRSFLEIAVEQSFEIVGIVRETLEILSIFGLKSSLTALLTCNFLPSTTRTASVSSLASTNFSLITSLSASTGTKKIL